MRVQTITPPAAYPVSLAEARAALRIDAGDEDALLAGYIATATRHVENETGLQLIARSCRAWLHRWPKGGVVELEAAPLITVDQVRTFDAADVATVLDPAWYLVDTASDRGRLVLRRGYSWPTSLREASAIEMEWTSGFGENPADVPEELRQAILLLVGHWHRNRAASSADQLAMIPAGVDALLLNHRLWAF